MFNIMSNMRYHTFQVRYLVMIYQTSFNRACQRITKPAKYCTFDQIHPSYAEIYAFVSLHEGFMTGKFISNWTLSIFFPKNFIPGFGFCCSDFQAALLSKLSMSK